MTRDTEQKTPPSVLLRARPVFIFLLKILWKKRSKIQQFTGFF